MRITEVKYRNMEFIIDRNASPHNHLHHKIPIYISHFGIYFNIIDTKFSYKKNPNNFHFNLQIVSIKIDSIDWPVTNLHDNGVCKIQDNLFSLTNIQRYREKHVTYTRIQSSGQYS